MATKETTPLNPRAIFSKTGKGVQEASGKTSHLSRGDRAVLKEIDGKTTLADIALKFEKIPADKFDALIQQFDKDGFVREVSSGAAEPIAPLRKVAPAPPKAAPKPAGNAADGLDFSKAAPPPKGGGDDMDFTSFAPSPPKPAAPPPPKAPAIDLAAAARAEAEKKAKEQAATDYRARQEAESKAAAEAKARAEAEAKARAAAEAKAKAEAEAKAAAEAKAKAEAEARAKAESEARARAEAETKAKQARDMALRMAAEAKAKAEAEAKDKARLEAELKAKLEEERKAREEAEKRAEEAAERARKELEEKNKREGEELRQRLEAEMKAKLEEERRAREEEDRKRREEEEQRRKEERERHEKELAERRAKEEAERKQREEEDRKRREEQERRHKEEDERRERERAERRAKEEAESKRREEEDRKRREEQARRHKDEDERREKERAERREKEDAERRAKEDAGRKAAKEEAPEPAAAAAAAGGGADLGSLLGDLDSFGQKEEEERKAKEEAERREKEESARRARDEEDRRRREAEEKKRREEDERRAKEDAERKAKEDEERRAREEEERRKDEEAERKRKAQEAQEKKQAEQRAAEQKAAEATLPPRSKAPGAGAAKADDIGVSDEDLDMDDVRRDESRVSREARQAARERDQVAAVVAKRPVKWGKPVAIAVFVILIGGIGALQVMPLSASDYEKAAAEALGVPVKVASARLSVITGVQVNLSDVTVGDVKIRLVRGYPEVGSLFGPKKSFNRIELEGASVSQAQLGEALFGKVGGPNFRVGRIVAKGLKAEGPLALPPLDVDATVGGEGALQAVNISGPDKLAMKLTPNGNEIAFEASAASLAIPFVPALSLSDFGWKGTANRQGVASSEFDGRQFDGLISGTARVRWGSNWTVEGEVRSRGVKVAVFAPALVSEGKVEARGNYTLSGPNPAKLGESARAEGSFKIENGVIGNFSLRRALETGGAQTGGTTEFSELTGQGVYDKGTVQLRNLNIGSGAMNAGANLDIDAGGNLAGRIAAEVKTPNQTLRTVLNITGTTQNPVIKK
ncbi:MAG TPA: hypothetical protein VHN19_12165 [Burkholderiales bacterium]|nr:hypothetical protein [Burkholderiales bacterium]